MATKMSTEFNGRNTASNASTPTPERQKRLLPYINYYLSHQSTNQQRKDKTAQPTHVSPPQNKKFTPFLESNALPGPFIPIIKNQNAVIGYTPRPTSVEENPDYSTIYDTLVQLKQAQQSSRAPALLGYNLNPIYRKLQKFVPMHYYENQQYRGGVQPVKTIIETYTPTTIEITNEDQTYKNTPTPSKTYDQQSVYKVYRNKPQVNEPQTVENPQYTYRTENYEQEIVTTAKPFYGDKLIVRKPIILFPQEPLPHEKEYTQNEKPIIFAVQTTQKPPSNTIIDEKYIAQKYTPISTAQNTDYENVQLRQYIPVQFITEKHEPRYEQHYYSAPRPPVFQGHKPTEHANIQLITEKYEQQFYSTPPPQVVQTHRTVENTNILGKILKQLQNSNALPQTLTTDNIDNSIKTLVKILNSLRKQQRLKLKPIIVADENSEEEEDDSSEDTKPHYVPGTITQTFPANTIEGGTPGRPGIDYPALSSIPQTSFNCKTQRYKGFFGDPHTNCQVWHYCDLNGGQASFLCPNGTIFSQVALTCDWWYNVKCSSTPQLYVLNERLYKYIIPLSPKFPEDYSGPLVDRYLALKFKEMEEKMKKEKKKEESSQEEKDDSDQLQDIQNEKAAKSSEET